MMDSKRPTHYRGRPCVQHGRRRPLDILLAAEALEGSFATGVSNLHTGINGTLGVTDTRSRIEPATSEHANLMPAIDGILPNEIAPIKQRYYLNSLLY